MDPKSLSDCSFDSKSYLDDQIRALQRKANSIKADKVYFEFGGKIFDDMHASRVLPGYFPDMKFRIIRSFFKRADIIFVVSAKDIIRKRIRGDHKVTYDKESLWLLDCMKKNGVKIKNVVVARMPSDGAKPYVIRKFVSELKKRKISTFFLKECIDYTNPKKDWSSYSCNSFVPTCKKSVIILSPGGGSGKFGVCANQLFHEMKRGITPFYIKFETFPVHDLLVTHPLNLAYMAASADFYDLVMKDPHDKKSSSYNRDVENYELLRSLGRYFKKEGKIIRNITSATNMGVNVLSAHVNDWECVEKESVAEIGRRLIRHKYEVQRGQEDKMVLERLKNILSFL